MKDQNTNPFWGEGESADFGKIAIEYAAGEDVVLDAAFVQYECLVNMAHLVMLSKQKILNMKIVVKLLNGLREIIKLDQKGQFILKRELEDVHSNVEQYLIEKYGIQTGGYLRLGIARNDQVYTDTRIYMREKIILICKQLTDLIRGINQEAAKHFETVMPGYTHLRVSQPVTWAHFLTGKAYHFLDDLSNIIKHFDTVNQCPLGIFEMAGTHLPIDRNLTSRLLGFDKPTAHSLYTANQRGEIEAKLMAELSILAMHIKRTMNEVIIFSTHEFGLLTIDDLYTTGGTAQPNLKNPDTLEVVRANMAKLPSAFMEIYLIMECLPSGFNRDTQATKPVLFKSLETIIKSLPVVGGIIATLKVNKQQMEKAANINFSIAPSVAVQISVKAGISFRQAHKIVKTMIKDGFLKESFAEMTPEIIAEAAKKAIGREIKVSEEEIADFKEAEKCVRLQKSLGGPAPEEVRKMIKDIKLKLSTLKKDIALKEKKLDQAKKLLDKEANKIIMLN